jgi:hypothetical protein
MGMAYNISNTRISSSDIGNIPVWGFGSDPRAYPLGYEGNTLTKKGVWYNGRAKA